MDIQTIWIIALSISTPVAGVVGFAVQLREVKKGRLENEKLQLEIEALKVKAEAADKRIVQVTTEEVQRFSPGRTQFSRDYPSAAAPRAAEKPTLKERALVLAVILSVLVLVAYFFYDIYRLIMWLSTKL